MNKTLCCSGALLVLCCVPLKAQENIDELPSIAFLEYLADMTEIDGTFYGPQDINVESCQRSVSEREEQNNEKTNEASIESNSDQNDKTATEQECKHYD